MQICTGSATAKIAGVGVDQLRIVLSLSGESAATCERYAGHDWRPRGLPSMRFLGTPMLSGFKKTFIHLLGDDGPRLMYHCASGSLHGDIHFGELVPVARAVAMAEEAVERLDTAGIRSHFAARVARADFTGDVVFSTPTHFRYVMSAFKSMFVGGGRVVAPFGTGTLYIRASESVRAARLGRVYDKGAERASNAGWAIPSERYMRIEAEHLWGSADRPTLDALTAEVARVTFLDRFAGVGHGTVVLKDGLTRALGLLYGAGRIRMSEYEQMYAFLDLVRMGLAKDLYSRHTYNRRIRDARALGLDIPGEDGGIDLADPPDVRGLIVEMASRF